MKQKLIARRSQNQPIDPTRLLYFDEALIPQSLHHFPDVTRGRTRLTQNTLKITLMRLQPIQCQ